MTSPDGRRFYGVLLQLQPMLHFVLFRFLVFRFMWCLITKGDLETVLCIEGKVDCCCVASADLIERPQTHILILACLVVSCWPSSICRIVLFPSRSDSTQLHVLAVTSSLSGCEVQECFFAFGLLYHQGCDVTMVPCC